MEHMPHGEIAALMEVRTMDVAYLGEKIFLEEVKATGQVWVARGVNNNIYAVEIDKAGFSLPVWSSREKVAAFLKNARLVGPRLEPHPVPVETLARTWLSDRMMAIAELQINPDGMTTRVLILTAEEFIASQA